PKSRRSRKGVPNRSTVLKRWLEVRRVIDGDRNPTGKPIKGTVEDEIILALINKALQGDVAAIREILDTRYGKTKEQQDVNLSVDLRTDYGARLRLARAALAKLRTKIDSLVDYELSVNKDANREEVRQRILAALPQWCAEDWNVDLQHLLEATRENGD
ncbi:MAG: hypothetical protein M3247_05975, partial [Thermoproteota archaeon]|nr:hypothetical protein [Thermoproteota archaeon]